MHNFISTDFTLGILGGGQLGKMLILSTANYDLKTRVLDPDPNCSSSTYCNEFVEGNFNDYQTVLEFGLKCDVITVEIEHVNTRALRELKAMGKEVHPDPDMLEIIKDKGLQKNFYKRHGLPTSPFILVDDPAEFRELLANGSIKLPFVQKTRGAGYDGKGVKVVRRELDLEFLLPGPSIAEEAVEIEKELAVIVALSDGGEAKVFDVVEMEFNAEANLVEFLFCPARIDNLLKAEAKKLALDTAQAYGIRGLLAVEMFLTKKGTLLINEVAPRPHNSGHHTIDNCVTSQFEQHMRSVLNLPLGETTSLAPAVMGNILGADGHTGKVRYEGMEKALRIEGLKVHIYGKKTTKPFRKMGHFTVVDSNLERAIEKAREVNQMIKVISE